MDHIPIVDFIKLVAGNPSEKDWKSTAEEIFKALSGIGFVYIKNHGISSKTIERAFTESKKFFDLPDPIKEQSLKDIKISYNGYASPGQESLYADAAYEIRESYDVCGNLRFFPDDVAPEFKSSLTDLESESKPLIRKLLRVLAISLELEDEEFFIKRSTWLDDLNVPSYTTFRTLYYPPTWDKEIAPGTVRCADHSDYGTLTLLFQDAIGGLEVKAVNGKWVPADPIPGTVLINTGDLLEFWSGGLFPATHHRVLIPEVELKQKTPRQSMVFFTHPDDNVLIEPLKTSASSGATDYMPVTAKDHAKMRLEATYNF